MKKLIYLLLALCLQQLTFGQLKQAPEWSKNAVIYEVNIRQFTPEGTFSAFQRHLPRLKAMGVDIIWLMPVHPIGIKNRKGGLGSYYAVKDYKGVNPEFGEEEDFTNLVNATHEQGMKLIIDWVANHSSPDNVWVDEGKKEYYTLDSTGNLQPTIGTDWWDVADLNYENKEMRSRMIDAMKFWVDKYGIDGFRCDVAGWVPIDFWKEMRVELDKVKDLFFLAEAEEPLMHEAFHMTYGWEFHHIMNKIAQGKEGKAAIIKYLEEQPNKYKPEDIRMQFTSNHDENSWNGTEMERLGDARLAMAVLANTIEGMPLIYNGQETSMTKRLRFFEKDTIPWTTMDLTHFYTELNKLHHEHPALWAGKYGATVEVIPTGDSSNVFAFVRKAGKKEVWVFLNLSETNTSFSLRDNRLRGVYTDWLSGTNKKTVKCKKRLKLSMEPWDYKILTN
jgi:cyclomaltodextrinase